MIELRWIVWNKRTSIWHGNEPAEMQITEKRKLQYRWQPDSPALSDGYAYVWSEWTDVPEVKETGLTADEK